MLPATKNFAERLLPKKNESATGSAGTMTEEQKREYAIAVQAMEMEKKIVRESGVAPGKGKAANFCCW